MRRDRTADRMEQGCLTDKDGNPVATQLTAANKCLFRAHVPPLGAAVYLLHQEAGVASKGALATIQNDGVCRIETDLYSLVLDPARGGVITRLATKGRHPKVFTDEKALRGFNELRGNFYREGGFRSSTETPAHLAIIENGPLRVRVRIEGHLAETPFTQILTLEQGEPRIDVHLEMHWTANQSIGESPDSMKGYPLKMEFYNDSFKLQALFPVALHGQKVYKNAPFDVLKSRLPDTFFDSWDSIKNVVVLNWVDITDATDKYGLAIFSDETTSYAHGPRYPLALTIQYSGPGLFGRDYSITGPTVMDYAILPHTGRWDQAGIWTAGTRWNEPLLARVGSAQAAQQIHSMFQLANPGWEVSAINVVGNDLLIRLFNAEGKDSLQRISTYLPIKNVYLVALDGQMLKQLDVIKDFTDKNSISITAPRFGIRTIQLKDVVK